MVRGVASVPSLCGRRSTLLVVIHSFRQAEPSVHPLLPDRVAGRCKRRGVERAHRDTADTRVAVPFPVQRAAAVRAEMKPNAVAAVGIALIDLPLAVKPDPLFQIARTEMKGGAGAALASLAVAQVHPIRFACGNYSKGAAVALPDPFQNAPPVSAKASLADLPSCRRAASTKGV
jgi:hypothetical protein